MMICNLYGRLGNDPVQRTTKAGAAMTTASIAVDVAGKDQEAATLWVNMLAFGHQAETLMRASKGEMVAAMGRLARGEYTAKDGTQREQWSLMADSVVVAKSARPTGKPRAT